MSLLTVWPSRQTTQAPKIAARSASPVQYQVGGLAAARLQPSCDAARHKELGDMGAIFGKAPETVPHVKNDAQRALAFQHVEAALDVRGRPAAKGRYVNVAGFVLEKLELDG